MSSALLDIDHLGKAFRVNGAKKNVLTGLSLSLARGEFLCVLGRSGCGKSTLINLVAGFIPPSSGRILVQGNPVEKPGPDRCVVFQEDALFPWLTVRENIAFGLKGKKRAEQRGRVDAFLEMTGLTPFQNYLPQEISGGMKQRVALARVLVLDPGILLMDEPFAALDAQTREEMQALLLDLWDRFHHTILFVTHDVREAVFLADRVLVMDRDRDHQVLDVNLQRPRNREDEDFSARARALREML